MRMGLSPQAAKEASAHTTGVAMWVVRLSPQFTSPRGDGREVSSWFDLSTDGALARPRIKIHSNVEVDVFLAGHYLQVLDAIIQAIMVTMMNVLSWQQRATKMLLHDHPMLTRGVTIDRDNLISRSDTSAAFGCMRQWVTGIAENTPSHVVFWAVSARMWRVVTVKNYAVLWGMLLAAYRRIAVHSPPCIMHRAQIASSARAVTVLEGAYFTKGRRRASVGFSHFRNLSFLCG